MTLFVQNLGRRIQNVLRQFPLNAGSVVTDAGDITLDDAELTIIVEPTELNVVLDDSELTITVEPTELTVTVDDSELTVTLDNDDLDVELDC